MSTDLSGGQERDSADLARFGYSQELKRSLGLFSSFAVAFSYISPSTGIFTLFALGLTTLGGVFIWTWPVVALGQFIVALNFAEVSSHYPVARDNQLPGSGFLAKVSPSLHTPVWSCVAVAAISAIPFIQYSGAGIIAIAATGMIYLSYFLGNIVIMRARVNGWPKTRAPFRLGRWGLLVNIVALVYGGAMLINFAWPRAASNPKPNETNGLLKLGFLDGIPILWTVVVVIALIGAIYYLAVGRTKAFAPVTTPSEDDAPLAGTGAAPPA